MTEAGAGAKWPPDHWQEHSFPHLDHAHAFYVIDHGRADLELPSVMLMHEFPGIKRNLVPLVDTLSQDFRVVIPSILGRDGDPKCWQSIKQICVRREVHVMARHGVSADVGWLRDFADEHVARRRNDPYGVIGMCFSGNFALALAVDPRVAAAVMAQPAIPVWPCALGLSRKDRDDLQSRTDLKVQGYRYGRDVISPAAKLSAAQGLLGDERLKTFPLSGSEERKHSTLTGPSASAEAIAGVRSFLRERLVAVP